MKTNFPFYKQPDAKDCGPTCLRIIAKHYGKLVSLQEIREYSETTRSGSNLLKLCEAAEAIGFKTIGARLDFNRLKQAQLPLIAHWDKRHFVVVYRIYISLVNTFNQWINPIQVFFSNRNAIFRFSMKPITFC
ncbi:cysteine peptidase family C39 domain-containing protein [Cyclobacterium jeungdonense]|uniref:Cysteine peptidase family C39 domain-containing protein n=1 Tax=Cyclobacterium jeungdonense TaxID=708087 RepID=A0ABT8C214_9BACT|nr:cysteine peptidase family C39 domain-containing protein [Cyclobacterium jeungdonense]MDN3686824.1 cysteine peptidase family C39 domain-containing protein [Cyclobacterium jeungdonense]